MRTLSNSNDFAVANPSSEVVSLLKALLDVMDSLELGLTAAEVPDTANVQAVTEGVRGIHRQMTELLFKYNVTGFTSLARPFDPQRHEAIAQATSEEIPVNHITQEVRRGYMIGDALFRPAQVLVCTGKEKPPESSDKVEAKTKPKPTPRQVAPQMSAASRPSWLLHTPESTERMVRIIGRASKVRRLEDGRILAADTVVPKLLEACSEQFPEDPLAETYKRVATELASRPEGCWDRLAKIVDEIDAWIEDYFWEQVSSEIEGTYYEVAVLASIDRRCLDDLTALYDTERWAGMVFADPNPVLAALMPIEGGGMIVAINQSSVGYRAGLQFGDLIIKVGHRQATDAASVRRMLAMAAGARRPVDVTFYRGLSEPQKARIEPRLAGRR